MGGLISHCHKGLYNYKGLMGREKDKEGERWKEGMTPKGWFPLFGKL